MNRTLTGLVVVFAAACGGPAGDPIDFAGTYAGNLSWERSFATPLGTSATFSEPSSIRLSVGGLGERVLAGLGVCQARNDVLDPTSNLIFDVVSADQLQLSTINGGCVYVVAGIIYVGAADPDNTFAVLEQDQLRLQLSAVLEDDDSGDFGVLTVDFVGTRSVGSGGL